MSDELSRFRSLQGFSGGCTKLLLVAIPITGAFFILDVPFYLRLDIQREQYLGLFLALVLGCVFLIVPATKTALRERVPWYDVILSILGFMVGLYIACLYPRLLMKLGNITPDRIIMGTMAILLILEGVRRLTGWILVTLGAVFVLYAKFSWLAPGMFHGKGLPWDVLSNYLFLDLNSMIGIPVRITATVILGFILFGNLLFGSGGGKSVTDISIGLMGRFRGGPAKMAVMASSLFGTISGSAVANVATTGVVTIPLMKRSGYKPHLAGAIEAVASTGGQFMPPIMGAAAFIMAEFLGIPYRHIAIAAAVPAILYYLAVFTQVDLEAGKGGLRGLEKDELPNIREALVTSWLFIIPLFVVVYILFILAFEPGKSAFIGAFSVVLLSQVKCETRFRSVWLLQALEQTGRGMLELSLLVCVAGLVIGCINVTGMGVVIPMFLSDLAGGNVLLLLFVVAIASIILGMGLPTIELYILLSVLVAPTLITFGIQPLAAHLFILYFGMLSMITPPICFASYTAAAIAGSDSMRTGYTGMRLGIVAYIVPFLFIFSPALLLQGSWADLILSVSTAMAGCFFLGVAGTGYLFGGMNWLRRGIAAVAGVGLLMPAQGKIAAFGLVSDMVGGGAAVVLLLWEFRARLRAEGARKGG